MVEIKEWKGLPRTILCYYKMIEDEGVEWAAWNHLLLVPTNGRNGGMEGAASNHILLHKYVQK